MQVLQMITEILWAATPFTAASCSTYYGLVRIGKETPSPADQNKRGDIFRAEKESAAD